MTLSLPVSVTACRGSRRGHAVFGAGGSLAGSKDVPGSPPEFDMTVTPDAGLRDGETVSVHVDTSEPDAGATPDCTAAPGTCVLALYRIEQDFAVTLYTTPLTFG